VCPDWSSFSMPLGRRLPAASLAWRRDMLGFAWSSWYGIVTAIAAGIVTLGTAIALVFGGARWLGERIRPAKPLVSFGHPGEEAVPWVFSIGGTDWEWEQQQARYEQARLSSLRVSYMIENKDTVALRDVTTGIRTRDGASEHAFPEHVMQILEPGATSKVEHVTVPEELHADMTDNDRAQNFLYWCRFDRAGRRWEAAYDPHARRTTYQRLGRYRSVGS
jgi:hypothetical protein